jgi:hypothetical protein
MVIECCNNYATAAVLKSKSYGCSQSLGGQEDVDDQAVAEEGHQPEEEEDNPEQFSML